jgi:hypothetical protein
MIKPVLPLIEYILDNFAISQPLLRLRQLIRHELHGFDKIDIRVAHYNYSNNVTYNSIFYAEFGVEEWTLENYDRYKEFHHAYEDFIVV